MVVAVLEGGEGGRRARVRAIAFVKITLLPNVKYFLTMNMILKLFLNQKIFLS